MNQEYFERVLGDDYQVSHIVETEESIYVFYNSRQFFESHGNDSYALVGSGPLWCDKKTGQHRQLGVVEFYEKHAHQEVFYKRDHEEKMLTVEEIIEKVKIRKHVNGDEFEKFMIQAGIDFSDIDITSEGSGIFIKIYSKKPDGITFFKQFFEKAELEHQLVDANTIIVKNE